MTTGEFTSTEWKRLVNAPQIIHHMLAAADRGAFFTKRSEAKALEAYLNSYQSQSTLVQSIIAGQKDADEKIKASRAEAQRMLEHVGALLEAKVDDAEGDAVREFLMSAAEAIAKAAREQTWKGSPTVSEAEEKTIDTIAKALRATETDKRRRHDAAAAAAARKRAEEQKREAEAKKRAEEARIKAEVEEKKREQARIKREAEAKERAEAARIKREAEAKKRAEEERLKREAEAAKREAEALKREAEEMKREAEAAKREAEAAKRELEAAQAAAEKAAEEIYVVKRGDTLSGIAKSVYGNAGRWREIFEANRDIIDKPNLIRPGWKLRIPR
jgi:LysM repeat protein